MSSRWNQPVGRWGRFAAGIVGGILTIGIEAVICDNTLAELRISLVINVLLCGFLLAFFPDELMERRRQERLRNRDR
jgi:hypothetical protein